MPKVPNQPQDEERETTDEPVVEGNREDSVEGHHLVINPVERVNDPGVALGAERMIFEPEK